MADMREALREEERNLLVQLEASPTFVKLQAVRELLAIYDQEDGVPKLPDRPPFVPRQMARPAPVQRRRQGDAARRRALEIAEQVLEGRTEPTKTADILSVVEAEGIALGGNSPVSNLSAMLSRSEKFVPHGRAGWTLASPPRADAADEPHTQQHRGGFTYAA